MKKIWTFLESFKRKLKFLESLERDQLEIWGKNEKKKKTKEFKRNKIKLIKLKNRKKKLKFQKIGKEFKEKLRGIWQTGTKLFQSKFWGRVFKNNDILRNILQN